MLESFKNLSLLITSAIEKNGVLAIFLGGLIEQIIVPIPSPLIATAGGFLLIPKDISFSLALKIAFLKITLPYTIAATLGLGIIYFIAYFGGKPLIDKFKGYLGFSWPEVEHLRKKFQGSFYDKILIVILRVIPVIPISIISGVCGFIRIPIFPFYIASMVGILIRSFILAILGWKTGQAYHIVTKGLNRIEDIISIIILVFIGLIFFWIYKKRSRFLKGKC